MKIIRVFRVPNGAGGVQEGYLVCADTARANRGEPIYLPCSAHSYSLMPTLCLRCRGVCKDVVPAKALEYVDSLGFALHMADESQAAELHRLHLPIAPAYSWDRCIVVTGFTGVAGPAEGLQAKRPLHRENGPYADGYTADGECLTLNHPPFDPHRPLCLRVGGGTLSNLAGEGGGTFELPPLRQAMVDVPEILAGVSGCFSLNTGDFVLLPLRDVAVALPLDCRVQLSVGGVQLMDEWVR
ncbi:MAG: hypothetical protein AL399_08910 [Candidatus [Bacteroides] periocalifornicus]|uniref:4Fe-4S ferredoxin-type domain-containing protein n=1 Tax=Candidatus [Bacteroides] periocalifornicus TaxID=1702214 RepID=A0A0Q4B5H7_9BACT|nr:MAG: hypothetical protein AL399_08910 [Candidatus [Bacteroides] periocalifornicus]